MDINWDRIARDADNSPRAVLEEALAYANDIENLVLVISKRSPEDPVEKEVQCITSGDGLSALALSVYAKNFMTKFVCGDSS